MAKFRKKPVVVDNAEQWLPKTKNWPGKNIPDSLGVIWEFDANGQVCAGIIETLEGHHQVSIGDWIITGIKGEKYPCKPDIFPLMYEPIDPPIPIEQIE